MATYIGVVGTSMVTLPEVFSGESQIRTEHFESSVCKLWTSDDNKLKLLKVRLIGKVQTAFQKLPATFAG